MAQQLIKLTVFKRNSRVPASSNMGIDVDDIVSPIRFNSTTSKSYFTARMMKDSASGKSENVGRNDYEVDETLADINALSDKLVLCTVTAINDKVLTTPESMVFCLSRIEEALTPNPDALVGGTEFMYHEDGYPQPIKYLVSQTISQIIASESTSSLQAIQAAASDEITPLTAGANKVTFRAPYAMTVTEVRASLTTAQTADGAGGIFTVDINKNGVTILSTKITIDNTEKTSVTAAIPAVISDPDIADDDEITVDIDQIGDGTATGLKVSIIGLPL